MSAVCHEWKLHWSDTVRFAFYRRLSVLLKLSRQRRRDSGRLNIVYRRQKLKRSQKRLWKTQSVFPLSRGYLYVILDGNRAFLTLISAGIFHMRRIWRHFFFFFCGAPTQTPPHLTLFFFQSRAQNQQNFILKTLKNHHHRPATHSAGFNSILWLFAVTFYAMTYLHFPFTPCFNTGGFTLPTYTDVISSSRCFRPHHFRRRTTRTLHRLCACSSDPRITCVWEAGGRASGLLGSPGGSGLAQSR